MSLLFDVEPEEKAGVVGQELPPLRGSDKQVPWAEAVRTKLLGAVHKHLREWGLLLETWERNGQDGDRIERERDAYRAAQRRVEEITAQEYAGWWLDRRTQTARELLNDVPPPPKDWGR